MKIAVFFPGIGYHCDKPLLYYSRQIIRQMDYDRIICLEYSYDGKNIRGNEEKMMAAFKALYKQAEQKLSDVSFDGYDDIVFISKSVGTIIAASYAAKYKINARHVFYTPLKYTFEYPVKEAVAFIGTADPWSVVPEVIEIAGQKNVPMHVYEGVNHSLESADALQNLSIITKVMEETRKFLYSE